MKTKGFTLIEVLIALVILATGLLGMASLMLTSLQSSQSAYTRSQASLMAYDLIERMRANYNQATTSDDYELALDAADTAPTDPGCATHTEGCTSAQQASTDVSQWWSALQTSIPGANATVTRTGNQYEILIAWEESGSSSDASEVAPYNPAALSFMLRVDL